jgi:hypothetical protein
MYQGDFSQDTAQMQEESVYQVIFTYPSTPKQVPLTNAVRKGNSIAFFFRTIPDKEAFEKLVKFAEGDFVNPAPHITKPLGGVHKKVMQKINNQWEEIK